MKNTATPKDAEQSESMNWRLEQWFPDLPPQQHQLLKKFNDDLQKFSKTINLVSAKTLPTADLTHFSDCIFASKLISKNLPRNATEIYDIGSGNGFPGVIFSILNPNIKTILVDSDQRKAEFLKNVVQSLGLTNTLVMVKTIESFSDGSVKLAMSRGFAPLSKAIMLTRKVFPKGGVYFHLKGEEWASEIASIPSQLCSYWLPGFLGDYKLPQGEVKFSVVKTEKIGE